MKVWIVYGISEYEGMGPPAGVYSTKEAAEAAKATIDGEPTMIKVEEFEVDATPLPYR